MTRLAMTLPLLAMLSACTVPLGPRSGDKGKLIDGLKHADFALGAMSIGQAKDIDHARAEGLGLVPRSPFDTYLNGILSKLLAQAPARNVPARVYVRASQGWAAKTTADANIYVSLGTLLRLDNEDEVAALLAHEASHVMLGHANTDVIQDVEQRAIQLSTIALAARDVVEHGGRRGAVSRGADDARVQQQTKALLVNTLLIAPAWNRGQERDADLLGTDLLVRAGYSPQAVLSLLRKQVEDENSRKHDPQAQYLEQQLSQLGITDVQKTRDYGAQVASKPGVENKLLGTIINVGMDAAAKEGAKQLDEVKRSHPKAEERLADAQAYITREYPGQASAPTRIEPWEAAKEQSETADVLENYIAAIEAQQNLSEGNLKAARERSKASLTGPTRKHAYPNYVAAAVQRAQRNEQAALASYEAALAGPEPAGEIYVATSALYLQAGKRDKARQVLEAGYRRLQEPPTLTVPLIRTYRALGKQTDADRLAGQCALRWPKLQTLCAEEARGVHAAERGSR
jgi:predicted Zn-dependent protease